MSDLIYRDPLVEALDIMAKDAYILNRPIYEGLAKIIRGIAAVDAVEVVRCRECEHKHAISCEGIVLCTYHGKMIQMKSSDFCSYGERKTE